jgi:hypothetical protein
MLNYRIVYVLVLHEVFFITKARDKQCKVITAGGWTDTKLLNANSHKTRVRAAAPQTTRRLIFHNQPYINHVLKHLAQHTTPTEQ